MSWSCGVCNYLSFETVAVMRIFSSWRHHLIAERARPCSTKTRIPSLQTHPPPS